MTLKLSRRNFLAGASSIGLIGLRGNARATSHAFDKPNIIFIMADDLGYADIGAYGHRHIGTPHIDSLAHDGLKLTQGYANSSICSPTRAALATGCYQQRFAVGLEEPISGPETSAGIGIPTGQPTIASVLREQGYETALVGKWHLGNPPHHGPLSNGYDHFFGIANGAADYFRHKMIMGGREFGSGLFEDNDEIERIGYLTDLLGDEAVKHIKQKKEKPLFLSLHFTAPHWPWEGREDEEVSKQIKNFMHYEGGTLEKYAEMVRAMDDNVGKVLKALEEEGMADNSIVVFTSDNGGERFSDTWPFVGSKGELLEGGIRVPLLFRWPSQIPAGTQSEQVMISMDFLPTFLTVAGGGRATAGQFDGVNLLPQILGQSPKFDRTLFWRFKANKQAAVRQGDWKYLKLGDKEHLFNVADDPRERVLLKNKYPGKFEELRELHSQWNAGMLPYPEDSYSEQVKIHYPDRY